jgi:D-alanyl-D-alanine carboxypeptidase/D-alanyl-D-alanine-endopeptidase (penicillin-binding protein 4)
MKQKKRIFSAKPFLIYLSILLLSSCAAQRFAVDKTPLTKHFETNAVFRESHTGLMVYDPETKQIVYDYNSHRHFTPASNTKLLTYFAAINMLGDSIPSIRYCAAGDTLYFTGTGDPTLLYENFGCGKTFDFLGKQSKPMAYVEKPIEDQRLGPGWAWDDYPYYYSTEKSSFPIYGNLVKLQKDSASNYISVVPDFFEDQLSIIHDENIKDFALERDEFTNRFTFKFSHIPGEIDEIVPFIYSRDLFTELLSDTLGRPVFMAQRFPAGEFKTLYSLPTDSISRQILTESDNFLAEHMLLLISNQLGDTLSTQKSIQFIMDNYLPELSNEINWVDGSGLSRYNQVTPHAMVMVLNHIYHKIPRDRLYALLPQSGASGTLESSFSAMDGRMHAKTGSMSHVYNVSGFLETKSGKTLLFSFMNNNFNVSFSELKREMERILTVFVNDTK